MDEFVSCRWLKTVEMIEEWRSTQTEAFVQGTNIVDDRENPPSPTKLTPEEREAANLFALFKQIQGTLGGSRIKGEWVQDKLTEILDGLQQDSTVAQGITKGRKKNSERKKDFLESCFLIII